MKLEKIIYEYVCDVCKRRHDTQLEMERCQYLHEYFVTGMSLYVYDDYVEKLAIIVKIDQQESRCLMEIPNGERKWVGFYSLTLRNTIQDMPISHNQVFGISGISKLGE